MTARATQDAPATRARSVVAEIAVRVNDRGPEPAWHQDRSLFGPWRRFEAALVAEGGPSALGFSACDALCRLVADHRAERAAAGVAS